MSSPGNISAPQPNYAQIILPPGFTLEEYLSLQGKLGMYDDFLMPFETADPSTAVTLAIAVACAVALGVWDL